MTTWTVLTRLHGIEGALLLEELYDVNFGIFDFIPIYIMYNDSMFPNRLDHIHIRNV